MVQLHPGAPWQCPRHGINTSESFYGSKVAPFASFFIPRTWWSSLARAGKIVQMAPEGLWWEELVESWHRGWHQPPLPSQPCRTCLCFPPSASGWKSFIHKFPLRKLQREFVDEAPSMGKTPVGSGVKSDSKMATRSLLGTCWGTC